MVARARKIATFNINNINKRLHNLVAWLAKAQPEAVCLQELKAEQQAFPAGALRDLGYPAAAVGRCTNRGLENFPEGSHRGPMFANGQAAGKPEAP
jgi:exodeoxyribonuclease-3